MDKLRKLLPNVTQEIESSAKSSLSRDSNTNTDKTKRVDYSSVLEEELLKVKEVLYKVEKRRAELHEKCICLEQDNARLEQRYSELQKVYAKVQEDCSALEARAASLQGDIVSLTQIWEARRAESHDYSCQVKQLKAELAMLHTGSSPPRPYA